MILSKKILSKINPADINVPDENIFQLPEKVLQFGAGVLLRGLPDYFIDKANRKKIFNGRIVIVKSTSGGDINAFAKQDGLYTICVRGINNGKTIEENIISSSISRVLSAKEDWEKVLQCAANADLSIIISNTTEVGIQLIKEDVRQSPPVSFPAKLLALLYERYKVFKGSAASGMIIIPTELLVDNAKKLAVIVTELAHENKLEEAFIEWLKNHNHFCNSLVDRIVPGRPGAEKLKTLQNELGYKDDLLIVAEPYHLWAIEGNDDVKNVLSFANADDGLIVTNDINRYRELKLRLLNGTHTMSCGLAHLAGFVTVNEAMKNKSFLSYVTNVMLNEIAAAIPFEISPEEANNFGLQVIDRFSNPFIEHHWLSITLNYTSKVQNRIIPVLLEYYKRYNTVPKYMSLGFAAYLLFMKAVKKDDDKYYGESNSEFYLINDEQAGYFYELCKTNNSEHIVNKVLKNKDFWGEDLSLLKGFLISVTNFLAALIKNGTADVLSKTPEANDN